MGTEYVEKVQDGCGDQRTSTEVDAKRGWRGYCQETVSKVKLPNINLYVMPVFDSITDTYEPLEDYK